ncbi:MAG: hypothetical protein N2652_10805 [Kiritimatiellae bacterium]|nr:hypothetical protein [Kiritimatiellia bacterium]
MKGKLVLIEVVEERARTLSSRGYRSRIAALHSAERRTFTMREGEGELVEVKPPEA